MSRRGSIFVKLHVSCRHQGNIPENFPGPGPSPNTPIRAKWSPLRRRCICLLDNNGAILCVAVWRYLVVLSTSRLHGGYAETTPLEPAHSAVLSPASRVCQPQLTSPGLFHPEPRCSGLAMFQCGVLASGRCVGSTATCIKYRQRILATQCLDRLETLPRLK